MKPLRLRRPRAIPSPNIWHWPEVYEQENRAQDADGTLWRAVAEVAPVDSLDVLDVGCGSGFHLPRFAATARSVLGVEPHQPLVDAARERTADLAGVGVRCGFAEDLPLPDRSVDVVHARTAAYFGPGCERSLAEAQRVLRPGGVLVVVDLDGSRSAYGAWMRADLPRYDPAGVERFFDAQGFTLRRVLSRWQLPDRDTLAAVLGIEFSPEVARRALAQTTELHLDVAYRVHWRRSGLAR